MNSAIGKALLLSILIGKALQANGQTNRITFACQKEIELQSRIQFPFFGFLTTGPNALCSGPLFSSNYSGNSMRRLPIQCRIVWNTQSNEPTDLIEITDNGKVVKLNKIFWLLSQTSHPQTVTLRTSGASNSTVVIQGCSLESPTRPGFQLKPKSRLSLVLFLLSWILLGVLLGQIIIICIVYEVYFY